MNSSSVAVGGAVSSCVCLVVCLLAVCAIVVILNKGGEGSLLGDKNPMLKDTVGKGAVIPASGVEAVVRAAAASTTPAQVTTAIRAQKGTAVKRSDLTVALRKLSLLDQSKAVQALMGVESSDVASINFGLATMAYLLEGAPDQVYRDTTATCPMDYEPCSAPKFNEFSGQTATEAFKKEGIPANQLCCRYSNAAGDPRPSCKKSVQKARSTFAIIMLTLQIAIGLVPLPYVGLLSEGMKGASRFFANLLAQGGIGFAIDASIISPIIETVDSSLEGKPMRKCCKDAFFNGDPANSFVLKKYTDDDGKTQTGAWQTENGCPVIYGLPQILEYSKELGAAISEGMRTYSISERERLGEDSFPNAGQKNCSEGCMRIISYDQWALANKKPIWCRVVCPNPNKRMADQKGRCSFVCDTTPAAP